MQWNRNLQFTTIDYDMVEIPLALSHASQKLSKTYEPKKNISNIKPSWGSFPYETTRPHTGNSQLRIYLLQFPWSFEIWVVPWPFPSCQNHGHLGGPAQASPFQAWTNRWWLRLVIGIQPATKPIAEDWNHNRKFLLLVVRKVCMCIHGIHGIHGIHVCRYVGM